MSAASDKYIRCSAIVCEATGTRLELGAKIRKNQAPIKPPTARRTRATTVAPTNILRSSSCHQTVAALVMVAVP